MCLDGEFTEVRGETEGRPYVGSEKLLLIRNDCVRFSGYDQRHGRWKRGEASSDQVGHGVAQAPGALLVVFRLLYGGGGPHPPRHYRVPRAGGDGGFRGGG